MRISNSFSEGEIQVLEFILQTLLRGGSPAMATRNKDFASLYRKVMSMKKRLNDKQQSQEVSSVGTINGAEAESAESGSVDLDDEREAM